MEEKFEPRPRENLIITKNVVIIGLAFMVHFTAYCGAANLQSSINAEDGLGTASLAAVYAGLIVSNMFLPAIMIRFLGPKWTICASFVMYMPWIATQLWPRFYTMIPAAILLGVGGAPLWCSKKIYILIVSKAWSKITNIPVDVLFTRLLGLFTMLFLFNSIWGNLLSSLVISSGDNEAAYTSVNASLIPEVCGANFIVDEDAGNVLKPQPKEKIQMLTGIFLACMAGAALIVAVGVDSVKRYELLLDKSETGTGSLFGMTLQVMVEPNQLMMITVNVFIGFAQAFSGAEFTAAYVSCVIGTGSIGFVMMGSGIADAIGCLVTGYLSKITGRVPLITLAFIVQGALYTFMLTWRPQADHQAVVYGIAMIWGACDSIWIIQIASFASGLFPGREEAAYCNFSLWESMGFIIAYITSPYLRISTKIYIQIVLMVVGVAFYFVVEYRQKQKQKREAEKSQKEVEKYTAYTNTAFSVSE
ncbi:UNC93-like protein [Aricia agestis]|uniref:UNC93-like protein n=1 Tax=Aricia agestis TaxID=91739 RepID=UPI001C20850A|nr:UNC93-like protein [Aricia agestis]